MMKKIFSFQYYSLLPLFLFGFMSFAQVTSEIDTTRIRIGEQIQYQIIVNETEDVKFTKLFLDNLKRLEVVESFKIDSLKNQLIKKYALTSFDSGRYVLPAQTVFIKDKMYLTDSIIIDVATIATDTIRQPLFHIKNIQKEPYTFRDIITAYWWLILIILVIAAILYFVLRDKVVHYEKSKLPPFDLAMQRLKELDGKQLLKQEKIKLYYIELTDIVRTFIEREMNIPALESTTGELLETITDFNDSNNLNIPKETIDKLQKLLKDADLVKFAKLKPLLNEIEIHRTSAENIIDNLHPKIVEKNKDNEDD
ncbi:MAG: BatD family protein [Flavobacteriaceae bacterium]|nr:BatD family protein [Flavobacteriaceae bacterium]